jgi:hypothetical protein
MAAEASPGARPLLSLLPILGAGYNPAMITLSMMALFACLGTLWGWKAASVRLQTGTGPKWKRPADVGRRVHAHRVRRRRRLWRLGYTGMCTILGAVAGYSIFWFFWVLRGFLSNYM